ncbi:WLM-domain-containing protein [Polychaeton citri CBS 116435]|uniref:WLM-domain-containing protein n=1 Tax=Polychaeton citri CBS 116435 TaxID=1314669 RepID=A0A9P4Q0U3_9PEZI|nr:WLM-domain-containing protein [Polychaeton citri CBS 116435]
MPLGFQRLNERHQRPNTLINFIKPLPSSASTSSGNEALTSHAFLERIAAQCYPVMHANHISVMSLEEYPPNPEFLGRNFNAGEVIQLVLKDKRGNWLSFRFVQMVMMHELAHCKQMNHSRAFWGVRNAFAEEMKGLWGKGYLGEGVWGRGRQLENGTFVGDGRIPEREDVPEHLCGGTYRRRGRKRKRNGQSNANADGEKLSYAKRQQRRIARKFGVHGEGSTVGDDELLRGALESGPGKKRGQGKPKVAKSKRGRDLRAAAALARFEAAQNHQRQMKLKTEIKDEANRETSPSIKTEPLDEDDIETESEGYDSDGTEDLASIKNEIDIPTDSGLIRVCGDDNEEDNKDINHEMDELRQMNQEIPLHHTPQSKPASSASARRAEALQKQDAASASPSSGPTELDQTSLQQGQVREQANDKGLPSTADSLQSSADCPVCSLTNIPTSPTCAACSHVLRPDLIVSSWRCQSDACRDSLYVNAGDVGLCGICGARAPERSSKHLINSARVGGRGRNKERGKSSSQGVQAPGERLMGVTGEELLRWD